MRIDEVSLDSVSPPANANRMEMDQTDLETLARSIEQIGLINPVTVVCVGENLYEIVAGHRRWSAFHMLRRATIPVRIIEEGELTQTEIKFAENLERADLSPIEEALALNEIYQQNTLDIDQLAERMHRTRAWIEARLALLDLPDEIQQSLHKKEITIAAARELGKVDDERHRRYLHEYVRNTGASTSIVRAWVNEFEAQKTRGDFEDGQQPPLPDFSQPIVILVPCAFCDAATDHRQTQLLRVCTPCYREYMTTQKASCDD